MGSINYFTSDYIAMGLKPEALNNYISACYEDDFANIEAEKATPDRLRRVRFSSLLSGLVSEI